MIHVALSFIVPLVVAFAFYRDRWCNTYLLFLAGMVVDIDHLLADPIYDPNRCSIGFHPLHTAPAIAFYVAMTVVPLFAGRHAIGRRLRPRARTLHLMGLGLLIHMALDAIDCLI